MITIRLLDARRGLNRKCEELFRDPKISEAIYRFLCDGIEECEDAEPERTKGKWTEKEVIYIKDTKDAIDAWQSCKCSICGHYNTQPYMYYFIEPNYCSFCGADMREDSEDD